MSETLDDLDYDSPAGKYRRWLVEIQEAEQWCKPWHDDARKCLRRYRDRDSNGDEARKSGKRLNIFWSNVSTLQPALYARRPKPVVERRYRDADPVGKVASELLQRAATFAIDGDGFDAVMKQVRDDRLIVGRGTAWVRYVPHFAADGAPADGLSITTDAGEHESGEGAGDAVASPAEEIAYEEVAHDYVAWRDFLMSPARTWAEVRWVARKVPMARADLVRRFGEAGRAVPLDTVALPGKDDPDSPAAKLRKGLAARATVYEIWDKAERRVCWLAKGHEALLDERPDPLRLREFFPCPKPVFATVTTDSLLPIPDFYLYKDQADDLDDVVARLSRLTEACRAAGVYDATQDASLGRLLQEGSDNRLIPVNNWGSFSDKGGMKGVMDFLPLDTIVAAIRELTAREQALKAQIYEITGISDIVRGYSEASETATAQQIKGRFATLRLNDAQKEIARFARDMVALTAEIISEHFQPQTIALMAGVAEQPPDFQAQFLPAVALLRSDVMRNFRVDIETDSTIEVDEQADKEAAAEFMAAMGGYLREALPAAQMAPELLPMFGETALFLARRYRSGRQLEGAIEQGFAALQQRAAQAPAQPRPDPKAEEARARMEMEREKAAADLQLQRERMAAELDLKREEMALRAQADAQRAEQEFGMKRAMAEAEARFRHEDAERADALERRRVEGPQELQMEELLARRQGELAETVRAPIEAQIGQVGEGLQAALQALQAVAERAEVIAQRLEEVASEMSAPAEIVRGPDGRAVGVRKGGKVRQIQRGPDGRATGLN